MEGAQLSYWHGFGGWVILLATTVTTALWLEGRPATRLLQWEWLRLGAIGLLLVLSSQSGLSVGSLVWGLAYGALNLLFLSLLSRTPQASDAAAAT
jgi:alkylglycerol monooxygenase